MEPWLLAPQRLACNDWMVQSLASISIYLEYGSDQNGSVIDCYPHKTESALPMTLPFAANLAGGLQIRRMIH
jgi:hypothetical protein